LLSDDDVDDEIGVKGTDVVSPFSDAGVPSDEDDLAAAWNASKVLSAVGFIDGEYHARIQATHDGTNTKKRGKINEEEGELYVRTLTTEEPKQVRRVHQSPSRCRRTFLLLLDRPGH